MFRLQYAERFGRQSLRHMRHSDYIFWGGTNALTSHMNKYKQMGFLLKDLLFVKDLILLGVGWWQYQGKPNLYTRLFLRRLLSLERIHSVRDSYTEGMLKSIGIENVVNTSCPTVWGITREHCRRIPTLKGKNHSRFVEVMAKESINCEFFDRATASHTTAKIGRAHV